MRQTLQIGKIKLHIFLRKAKEKGNGYSFLTFDADGAFNNGALGYTVKLNEDKVIIKNDVIGGGRIYYWQKGNDLFITDDNQTVIDMCHDFEIDENEYRYFKKHRCCTGNETFYKGVHKLQPAGELTVSKDGFQVRSYWHFAQITRNPNADSYKNAVRHAVDNSLLLLKNTSKKVILCFSGGTDSSYIANRMLALGVDFETAFFYSKKIDGEYKMAKAKAAKFGKDLYPANCDLDDTSLKDEIKVSTYFDTHNAVNYYLGIQGIIKHYGNDIVLVNGQNSDSILTYGPSETKRTSYWKRYFLYGKSMFRKKLYCGIISIAFRKHFSVPQTENDFIHAFFDNFKYCAILDNENSKEYDSWVESKLKGIQEQKNFSSLNNLLMYLKMFTFSQGSDTQIVISSLRGAQVLMPFSTASFIEAALMFKDDKKELINPKYVLKE